MIAAANSPTRIDPNAERPAREAFVRAHYRMQKGRFFTAVELCENGAHAASDVAAPMWNQSMWLDGALETFVAKAEQWHQEHERRPVVYAFESEQALGIEGFEQFDREAWMARDVQLSEAAARDFTVEAVSDLKEFAPIFRAAFNATKDYDALLAREPRDPSQRHFIAKAGAEAVAVGTVIVEGKLACIYNVGTTPEARGRGAGRAMMEALIQAAREEGCRWVFLQVEANSAAQRLYAKLGFETLFSRVGFRKSNWTAMPPESALSKALGFRGKVSGAGHEAREARSLSPELSSALSRVCEQQKISVENVATGLWSLLLARYLNINSITISARFGPQQCVVDAAMPVAKWLATTTGVGHANECEAAVIVGNARASAAHTVSLILPEAGLAKFEIAYRSELLSKECAARMAGHFLTLLSSFAANPDTTVGELEMLTAPERAQLLGEWSGGGEIAWNGESIVELIEGAARRAPAATALVTADSVANSPWTYTELMERAARRACDLVRLGVAPGAHVGVLLPRSLDVVVSILAIWRAGGVFVPLDSSYPADRLAFMASDTRMKAVVTTGSLASVAPANISRLLIEDSSGSESAASVRVEPHDPAYVIYTSGSTGQPKGVTISHGAIARHVLGMIRFYEITPQDRHLHFSAFTFDASFEQFLPPLAAGASVAVRDERMWDVNEFIRNARALGLTMADLPMGYWRQLAETPAGESIPEKLRIMVVGGEAMSVEGVRKWQRGAFAKCRLVNAYGPTEGTVTATAFDAGRFQQSEHAALSVPIGRPLPGRFAYILNDSLQPVPVRVAGQLFIGGPLLAEGYLNRAEMTSERFIKNPFAEGRMYRTGDLARYLEDGSIEFLGRTDDQVKIRGFRVELGEIETALHEHPSVREAVVVARDDSKGSKRLVGYVTLRGEAISDRELRAWLRGRLPEYMVPSAIVVLPKFPLLNSGKVNRKALPEPQEEATPREAAIPTSPLELQLQIIFQRVLRRVGVAVDESFFDLGGDSLQALDLIMQIEKATCRRLPMETLFHTPTVRGIATSMQSASREWSCLAPLQKGASARPAVYFIHTTPGDVLGYGNLIHHLGSDQPCYGFQALGLKDGAQPHDSIEGMAAHYIELLRAFQPRGPYILGGWCFGGIVAVEMAQQLKTAGAEVAPLLLLETINVSPGLSHPAYYFQRFKRLFTMTPQRWREYLTAKARYRKQVEMDNRMRFKQAGDDVTEAQRRWLDRLELVYNANLSALDRYRSRYYAGKVILFNAVEQDAGILPDPNYGWAGMADEIEIHPAAGNHDTMLTEPNVATLAANLQNTLAKF
jgi:amino acid adenylation domain-containing protein